MELLWEGVSGALQLLADRDPLVWGATVRSLRISLVAVAVAAAIGIPFGSWLALRAFPGRWIIVVLCRAGMSVPTVLIGLLCYALFSRRGPLGGLDLLYTQWGIIVGEICLALPIMATWTHGAISELDPRVAETARTLGAGPVRRWRTYLSEARLGITLALLTAFARCFTELGIAMMVGGNIKFRTRTLTTATALETARGEFDRGVALSLILFCVAMIVTVLIACVGRRKRDE